MDLPNAFMLAGNRWTIHYKLGKKLDADNPAEDERTYGVTKSRFCEIWIRKGLSEDVEAQTVLHELGHAILDTMGHTEHDEVMVEAVAQLVYQLLITGEYTDDDREEVGT